MEEQNDDIPRMGSFDATPGKFRPLSIQDIVSNAADKRDHAILPINHNAIRQIVETGLHSENFLHPEDLVIGKDRVGIAKRLGGRENNQDNVSIQRIVESNGNDLGETLYIVADGMGGHQHGEDASRLAVIDISRHYQEKRQNGESVDRALLQSFELANKTIIETIGEENGGTTAVAVVIENSGKYSILNIGDSRSYHINPNGITQLTEDDTQIAKLLKEKKISKADIKGHPDQGVLLKALGYDKHIVPKFTHGKLLQGQRLLLCSDGVSGGLEEEEIYEASAYHTSPSELARDLTKAAIDLEGENADNTTAIVIQRSQ